MATIFSVDELPCAVISVSSDGRIATVNAALAGWLGLPKEKLIGAPLRDVLDDTVTPPQFYGASGETFAVTVAEQKPDESGQVRLLVLIPNDTPRAHSSGTTAVSHEDTQRALEDANALLDTIFETAPIGLGVWDHDLRFIRVNKRLAEINGVSPEDHIGKRPHEILPEIVDIDAIYARWREILETGESWNNIEVRGVTPAAPGHVRTWDENFYPIKAQGRIVGIGAVVEETTERKRNLEHIKTLVKELNHRCKNLLSIVLAIARQTSRGGDPAEFISRFTNRIQGLVASHDLLVRDDWTGVAIGDLVRGQLAPFEELIGKRVHISGPVVRLCPSAAQGLGMAIHELATNAAKYGALSTATGEVEIAWDIEIATGDADCHERLSARWEERGGPPVTPPAREGFGQLVIGKLLEAAVNGEVTVEFKPDGVRWTLSAPTLGNLEDAPR